MKTCSKEGCERNVWSKGLCIVHSPKPKIAKRESYINSMGTKTAENMADVKLKQEIFFKGIWNKRKHVSELSGEYLGKEPKTIFFHHLLPKSKYPQAEFDEENIILVTVIEHMTVEGNIYKYDIINNRRKILKIKYNIL
jgi:hypothetical protein